MKTRNETITGILNVLRNKLTPVVDDQWQLIVVLIQVNMPNLRCHILYLDSNGIKVNLTESDIPEGISDLLLDLQDALFVSHTFWNELEVRFHQDSTTELDYFWNNPW